MTHRGSAWILTAVSHEAFKCIMRTSVFVGWIAQKKEESQNQRIAPTASLPFLVHDRAKSVELGKKRQEN